jgi:AcrR family transcriptional regulator
MDREAISLGLANSESAITIRAVVAPVRVERGRPASRRPLDVARADQTRSALIRAAIELFGRRGFEATSTREIARAVGIKAPSVYNHFNSKEELFGEAMIFILNEFLEEVVEPVDPTETHLDQLMGIVRRHVLYELDPMSLARTTDLLLEAERLGRYLSDDMRDRIRSAQRRLYETVRDVAAGAAAPNETTIDHSVLAFAIISMCDRVGTWFEPRHRLTPEQAAEHMCLLVRNMLGRVDGS